MTRSGTKGEYLIIVFRKRLRLALIEATPPSSIEIGGVRYMDSGLGDFTGFYDWLRDSNGQPIGVRYCPSAAAAGHFSEVASLPYVRRNGECLEIRFGALSQVDDSVSDDQAFGGNNILVSDAGEVALVFETYFLAEDELLAIKQAPADWSAVVIDTPPP